MTRSLCLIMLTVTIYNLVDVVQCTCSPVCTSCDNGNCKSCHAGSYLEAELCHTCPGNCTSCVNAETCTSCAEGYFGVSCAEECHVMCLNNTCNKDNGFCTHECIEGYFGSGASCTKCNDNCKTCINYANNCVVCKDGLYGPSCQNNCSHCKDSLCAKDSCTHGCGNGFYKKYEACSPCNTACTSCETFHNCTACESGYFGSLCQFQCNDCTPCNKEDGLCPGTTTSLKPISTTPPIPTSASLTSPPATTALAQTTPLNLSKSLVSTSTSVQQLTNSSYAQRLTETNVERQSQDSPSVDKAIIIYAAAGGGGGLVVIILIVVFVVVCKRQGLSKQSETIAENMEMTENEQYISVDDIDESLRRSTSAHTDVDYNGQEDSDAVYSLPNKTQRSSVVTTDTESAKRQDDRRCNIPPNIPVKNNLYS